MNKKILSILVALTFAVFMAVGASAADSLLDAVNALGGAGGTVTITSDVTVADGTVIPEQSGNLTIVAENGAKLILEGTLIFEKNTNSNVITVNLPVSATEGVIYGGFNSVTFGTDFAVTGTLDFYGGLYNVESTDGATTTSPEYYYAKNQLITAELPYDIIVNAGTFRHFAGGNYRLGINSILGSIAAPITITVNGGTFGSAVSYDANTALKVDKAFSISGQSILADDATLTINGGTFNTPIYAQGYIGQTSTYTSACSQYVNSDKKFYAIDGDIAININGGTLNGFEVGATQITATYLQLVRGNYTVTVKEDANLASGIIFDATQVKAYAGENNVATLNYTNAATATAKNFDSATGCENTIAEPLRIACVGDSITQGTGATINGVNNFELGSYPAQLYKKMFDLGENVVIANYGCGGTRVMDTGGWHYASGLAYTLSMEETDPDYVIVGLGTNDSSYIVVTYGMQDRFYEDYTALISGYEALASTEMVYGTSATYRSERDVATVSNIRGLQAMALDALNKAGKAVTYVDLYALTLDVALAGQFLSGDLLHPDLEGYTTYADIIYDAIRNGVTSVPDFEMTDIYVSASGTNNAECTADNPTNNISIAFAKAKDNSVIHIIGSYDYTKIGTNYGFPTPVNVKNLTIKGEINGEGDDAALNLSCKHLHIKNDTTFDNIGVYTTAGGALHIACGYNNVTFTETFKCADALFAAGMIALGEDRNSQWYNSRESISSDKDCVINVNGGQFDYFLGGNYLFSGFAASIYGTYSGNMTINIGPNVEITHGVRNGACGQNYLAGNITLNVASWPERYVVREFGWLGDATESASYNVMNNTGTITVNFLNGLTNGVAKAGDIDGSGVVDIKDSLTMLDYVLNGVPQSVTSSGSAYYYGIVDFDMLEVMRSLKKLAQ